MKNLTIYPMSSYKNKIAGLVITAVALILVLVVSLHGPLPFLHKPTGSRQFDFFLVLLAFGMYMTAFSKEKNDDERVHAIRAKALQVAFMLLTGTLVAISLTSSLAREPLDADMTMLCSMTIFGLAVYLIVFHIGLYFDPAWAYNDDTVMVNLRKNKTFFIIYVGVAIILAALVILIHKA